MPLSEPWWGSLSFGRPVVHDPARGQPPEHATGFREVTGVRIVGPLTGELSAAARAVADAGAVVLDTGPEHFLELTFDNGTAGGAADFRPALPLVFCW